MQYQTFEPPDLLKPFVRYFWSLESTGDSTLQRSFTTIADGCPGLIFQQADKGTLYQNGKQLPEFFLFGQTTRHATLDIEGSFGTVGIYFHPHAINALFRLTPGELTDSCMEADLLADRRQLHLSEQLANAPSAAHQVDLLITFLSARAHKTNKLQDDTIHDAVMQIIRWKGNIPLKQLQEKLKLSERTFERKVKQQIGISPKLFSRICRFQSSLKQLKNSEYQKLSDIAFEHNYADQSHFIRSFKEFAGVSPHQYHKQLHEVVENLSEVIA